MNIVLIDQGCDSSCALQQGRASQLLVQPPKARPQRI